MKSCPVCQKLFDSSNVTCSRSCSNTFFRTKRHSEASRKKRSETLKGRRCPKPSPLLLHKQCCICEKEFPCRPAESKKKSTCGTAECVSKNRSQKLKGKTGGPRPGGGWGKSSLYAGVVWDSTWEILLIKRLEEISVRWVRSNTKDHAVSYVDLSGRTRNYYPDVYLPDYDLYIEVKGYWTPEAKLKLETALKSKKLIALDSIEKIEKYHPGISYSGITVDSKPTDVGSIPTVPAT